MKGCQLDTSFCPNDHFSAIPTLKHQLPSSFAFDNLNIVILSLGFSKIRRKSKHLLCRSLLQQDQGARNLKLMSCSRGLYLMMWLMAGQVSFVLHLSLPRVYMCRRTISDISFHYCLQRVEYRIYLCMMCTRVLYAPLFWTALWQKKRGSRKQRMWLRRNSVKTSWFGNTLKTTTRSSLQK